MIDSSIVLQVEGFVIVPAAMLQLSFLSQPHRQRRTIFQLLFAASRTSRGVTALATFVESLVILGVFRLECSLDSFPYQFS